MNMKANIKEIEASVARGLTSLASPAPQRLSEWADENFYLSAESSYTEGRWETLPFQKAIMDCISNDDIRELVFKKSARVGYTKMIMAAMGYFAEHKKRNQAVWQPVDDDADEFVKTEIEPMIRDIPVLKKIFPSYEKKSKHNTLSLKVFTGSSLHIRGGKAAKNYRRLSVDVAYLDEVAGFDSDIEKEGDPYTLSAKRIEGSTFPKHISGSTPKLAGSLLDKAVENCEMVFDFYVPCPHCGERIKLVWGAKDSQEGFKWLDNNPETAAYLCGECASLFTQDEYLQIYDQGRYQTEDGDYIDDDGFFRNEVDEIIPTPLSVAFQLWTAYSPMNSWARIVKEFLDTKGEPTKLKTFVNTTLGESWEEDEAEKLPSDQLYGRREHYDAEVPNDVQVLTAAVDTQDDRFEIQVDGWGEGEERWGVDYIRLYGDPSRRNIWDKLAKQLRKTYSKASGEIMDIRLACQDHGGHYSDEVNQFSKRMGVRFLIPIHGSSTYGKPIATFPRKRNKKGVYLTEIGTDTVKDLMFYRLQIMEPGPAYWHFPVSDAFDNEYFKQLTAEERVVKWVKGKKTFYWDAKKRRNEPWDNSGYNLAAIRILQQHFGLVLKKPDPDAVKIEQKSVTRTGPRSGRFRR